MAKSINDKIEVIYNRSRQTIANWLAAYTMSEEQRTLSSALYMPRKKPLMDIYDYALLDNHLSAVIGQRVDRILGEHFRVVPKDSDEDKYDKEATKLIDKPWFYDLVRLIMDAEFYGYSLIEFEQKDGKEITGVNLVERRNTIPERKVVLRRPYDNKGINFTKGNYEDRYALVYNKKHGLLLKAAPVSIYKRYALGAWVQGAEGFGMPFITVKTINNSEGEKVRIANDLAETRRDRFAVAEIGDEFDVFQMGHTDAHKIYDALVERCNSEMSKLILGATLTVDGGASYSQSGSHEKVVTNRANADRRIIENYVNNVIFPKLINLGYTELDGKKLKLTNKVVPTYEEATEAFKILANHYEIEQDEIEKHLGIRVGERLLRPVNQYQGAAPADTKTGKDNGSMEPRETNSSPTSSSKG